MSDSAEELLLDFSGSEEKAGFRLERLEVLNWGTFDRRVWKLEARGRDTLLTGDIGSGKSTLVDAVSTLLVPPQRLAYNKAAGAGARERSLRSYVLGYYKSERGESDLGSKAVALRDQNAYSVLLGVFANEGLGQICTLAQVFTVRDQGQPTRFYVFAGRELSIAEDFAGFGGELAELRKRLRGKEGVELFEAFPAYSAAWRRVFGIENEQALELFNQTVSMKSVGNLTDFVREHMLEPFDGARRVEALVAHFEDLDRAHAAVLKAKAQLAALEPLAEDCLALEGEEAGRETRRRARDAVAPWFAGLRLELLDKRLSRLDAEILRVEAKTGSAEETVGRLRADRDELRVAIATNGGDRLERLAAEIRDARAERDRRRERLERHAASAAALGLALPRDAETFAANRARADGLREELHEEEERLQNDRTEREVAFRLGRERRESLAIELASLRARKSNIPAAQVAMRDELRDALGAPEGAFPFAGELIRVREGAVEWEGAAERLLRGFALSLLVGEEQYEAVSSWVEEHRLQGRLVYYRAREAAGRPRQELHPDSIVHKLELRRGAGFEDWLSRELARRFDYACCDSLERFRQEPFALTRRGQLKGSGDRHEKDDRSRIDDRSRYVLGWSNEAKIAALEIELRAREQELGEDGAAIARLQSAQASLKGRSDALARLLDAADWTELDWATPAARIAALEAEKAALEKAADKLKALSARLDALDAEIAAESAALEALRKESAQAELRRSEAAKERKLAAEAAEAEPAGAAALYALLRAFAEDAGLLANLSLESAANRERDLRELVQGQLDAADKRLARLRERIVAAMQSYRAAYPLETREVDASVAAAPAWLAMLEELRADGLPRFESAFKELLNENTIREVANFQSQLNRERQLIKERIGHINSSLAQIDYNPGRYIELEIRPSGDGEILDFQRDLRACTEGSLTGSGDEQYSEAKFLQVKRIVERFRGREGLSELDRRWTEKVGDVRQYFVFSASERWKEDGKEHEHYTDSGGKSGGQKEKLAYTVLAASLAYQFGLDTEAARSRSFRFVMIDEAFGRGSDESTRYGLELFRKMRLQLLVITPLQKIHVIEPYVASVGFVHNEAGRDSRLRNLAIGEYRAERDRRKAPGA